MALVASLLTLPTTSAGLTALRPTVVDSGGDGLTSPRHKIPRLDADSDSASASRCKAGFGSFKIPIIGGHAGKPLDANTQLAFLRRCIQIILTRNTPDNLPATYETIYRACRAIVTVLNAGDDLVEKLNMELEQCVARLARGLIDAADDSFAWLVAFVEACSWFEGQVELLKSLLAYLDQIHIRRKSDVPLIRDLAFGLFSNRIFCNPLIAQRIMQGVKEWSTWERRYRLKHNDRKTIRALVGHLLTHKQYSAFEEYYLEQTAEFYSAESAECLDTMKLDPVGFFKYAKLRIEEENERSEDILLAGSWAVVREVTEKSVWTGRLEWLSNETLRIYVAARDFAMLSAMYNLFGRVGAAQTLRAAFDHYIRGSVQKIVTNQEKDESMVQDLLDLRSLCLESINAAFRDVMGPASGTASTSAASQKEVNKTFVNTLHDAFKAGFRARRSKPAEMVAKFLDRTMRKGQGATGDAEYEALLDSVLALYRYTEDKDVFRTFYHRALAKRLLLEKSASNDFEIAMLKKLKTDYDPEFGMGEDMFKDLSLSRESMRDYHSILSLDSPGRRLSVVVLQRSAWPFSVRNTSVDLPSNMQEQLNAFTAFYSEKHSGHVLSWDHALGTTTLKGTFNTETKELSVSLYQAIVLLLFNSSPTLSFTDIKEQTRMEDSELRRTLQSLACGKKKVLKKVPQGRDVDEGDVFNFNADFADPFSRVHINSIQAKISPEESQRTNTSVESDRKHYLDAAIVRIMKARKEMTYEQLKTATIEAVKNHFVPSVDMIKKRVDALAESDYLERSPTDRNKFLYVA